MPAPPLAVLGIGLVSGLGSTAEASCAAIRCGINNFQETRFAGRNGEWLVGSEVALDHPVRGITRLAKMAACAIAECFAAADAEAAEIPVLLCVAEPERPGRIENLAQVLPQAIEHELGLRLHPHSQVIEQGRVGGAVAMLRARRLLSEARHARIVIAGTDSFLSAATLVGFDREDRLLRRDNPNGFIPGEAAAAVLLAAWQEQTTPPLLLRGLGFAREPAPIGSGKPLRAEGLVQAFRATLDDAAIALKECDLRISDANGEQYRFKEAALAITRLLRDRKVQFSLWHPADCIGEVGAAVMPAILSVLFQGARKDYLPGRVFLGHLGNDDDKRAAFVTQAMPAQSLALEQAAEAAYRTRRQSAA